MRTRDALRWAVALGFTGVGIAHFTHTRTLERIMPSYVPLQHELVLVSGAAELGGAAAFALGRGEMRRWAGWWLIATLIAVFPANVNMALNPGEFPEIWGGRTTLILRLPVQLLFIALVWLAMRDSELEPATFAV